MVIAGWRYVSKKRLWTRRNIEAGTPLNSDRAPSRRLCKVLHGAKPSDVEGENAQMRCFEKGVSWIFSTNKNDIETR